MKTVEFESRYFASQNEWEYFLSQLGVKTDPLKIYKIRIKVDTDDIIVELE